MFSATQDTLGELYLSVGDSILKSNDSDTLWESFAASFYCLKMSFLILDTLVNDIFLCGSFKVKDVKNRSYFKIFLYLL